MLQTERNFRVHLVLFCLLLIVSFYFKITPIEWAVLLLCSCAVFTLEMINSALESLCNKVEPQRDKDIAWIKDVSAGAVLVAAFFSLVIAALIFIPYILELYTTFGDSNT